MAKQNDMRERIRVETNSESIYKRGIEYRIHEYTMTKYMNTINEINLIKKILGYCKGDDVIKQDYLAELNVLKHQRSVLEDMLQKMDAEEEIYK